MRLIRFLLLALPINTCLAADEYTELLQLFKDWREFDRQHSARAGTMGDDRPGQ
jgi:hypothetical protein